MAIIVNNKLTDPTKNVVEATPRPIIQPQTRSQTAAPLPEPVIAPVVQQNQAAPTTGKSHTLIVNGVEKKISKSSSYLLDMMSVEK